MSEKGREDSFCFSKAVSSFPFRRICTSPLVRARETAEAIAKHHPNSSFSIIDELKERHWGDLQGVSSQKMYQIEKEEENSPSFTPGFGVERRSDFKARIQKGLERAFEVDEFPLLVSHGRLFLVLCELLGLPRLRQVPNVTLFEFQKCGNEWSYSAVGLSARHPQRRLLNHLQ